MVITRIGVLRWAQSESQQSCFNNILLTYLRAKISFVENVGKVDTTTGGDKELVAAAAVPLSSIGVIRGWRGWRGWRS
jgi:hypothetical protein